MNVERPHEIRRFSDGEEIPEDFIELTEEQFKILDPMTPDERAAWVQKNGMDSVLERLRRAGFVEKLHSGDPDKELDHERRAMLREQEKLLRRQGAQSHARGPAPPITPRQHRRQGR